MAQTLITDKNLATSGTMPAWDGSALTGISGGGKVLQVIQNHVTTTSSQSVNASTVTDISGLNVSITPSSSSSKILVKVRWMGDGSNGDINDGMWGIKRNSTVIGNPSAAGNRIVGIAGIYMGYTVNTDAASMDSTMYEYLDSPSTTSAITYHATFTVKTAQTMYNNISRGDGDATHVERGTSTITVMEIGA